MPLPGYVASPCCPDPEHITNIAEPEYESELKSRDGRYLIACLGPQQHAARQSLVHFRGNRGRSGGQPLTADDTGMAWILYTLQRRCTLGPCKSGGLHSWGNEWYWINWAGEKRPRLEKSDQVTCEQPMTTPPPPQTARPQGWSSGKLPARLPPSPTRGSFGGGGSSHSCGFVRGGTQWRSNQRGGCRGWLRGGQF
jgi:hypothetical protein